MVMSTFTRGYVSECRKFSEALEGPGFSLLSILHLLKDIGGLACYDMGEQDGSICLHVIYVMFIG